jgi:hypothetical protein
MSRARCGEGARPFEGETVRMRLDSTAFDSGVTLLRYEPLGVAQRAARCIGSAGAPGGQGHEPGKS